MNIRMWPDDGPPDLSNELIRAERYAVSLEEANSKLEKEVERLRAWLMRTASDDNLKHRAGYHGRRVMLEAAAVLNGHPIPDPNVR